MTKIKIALVASQFNQGIVDRLVTGALQRFAELQVSPEQTKLLWVPGAVEIPLTAQALAKTQRYQAIIALGAVIRGDTSHYDYVCQQVSYGCQKVALAYEVPVVFGVLTTDNEEQAEQRAGGREGNKGREAVDTALAMITTLQQIKQ